MIEYRWERGEYMYLLKHYDDALLPFDVEDNAYCKCNITWINESMKRYLPLDLDVSNDGLSRWTTHRNVPKNRAFVYTFLSKCGLSINRPMSIINVSKGLSLNDCYWITDYEFQGTYAEYNLYENRFSQILSRIVFTGYGSSIRTSLESCLEFTTNGILPKCWRRNNGKIKLFKGGTVGFSNTGFEPYSEYYTAVIGKTMDIDVISYNLAKWQGTLCSSCDLFTSMEYSFIPIGRITLAHNIDEVEQYYHSLGSDFIDKLYDMYVFDAIICNTDRHLGNFGLMIDNKTNTISHQAPLFDHGNSLFNFADNSCWESEEALQEYVDTLRPAMYDDFIIKAKNVMNDERREKVRKLFTFTFKGNKHSRYNLSDKRLKLIEQQICKRARLLIE